MGFLDEAKHKIEEVVGKVERTIGGAVGNEAMEVSGQAHVDHAEALLDAEESSMQRQSQDQPDPSAQDAGPQDPERMSEMNGAEAAVEAVRRREDEAADAAEQEEAESSDDDGGFRRKQ